MEEIRLAEMGDDGDARAEAPPEPSVEPAPSLNPALYASGPEPVVEEPIVIEEVASDNPAEAVAMEPDPELPQAPKLWGRFGYRDKAVREKCAKDNVPYEGNAHFLVPVEIGVGFRGGARHVTACGLSFAGEPVALDAEDDLCEACQDAEQHMEALSDALDASEEAWAAAVVTEE